MRFLVVAFALACDSADPSTSDGGARDAGPARDAGAATLDAARDGAITIRDGGSSIDAGSECGADRCTCRVRPDDDATTCWHSLGGLYGEGGCSAGYQCCAGSFRE